MALLITAASGNVRVHFPSPPTQSPTARLRYNSLKLSKDVAHACATTIQSPLHPGDAYFKLPDASCMPILASSLPPLVSAPNCQPTSLHSYPTDTVAPAHSFICVRTPLVQLPESPAVRLSLARLFSPLLSAPPARPNRQLDLRIP